MGGVQVPPDMKLPMGLVTDMSASSMTTRNSLLPHPLSEVAALEFGS